MHVRWKPRHLGSIVFASLILVLTLYHTTSTSAYASQSRQFEQAIRPAVTAPPSTHLGLAGYVVGSGSGNGFKAAEGYWNVPCTSAPVDGRHQAAVWVGLGGWYGNGNLFQAGVAVLPDGNGNPKYQLFIEMIGAPNPAPYYGPTVSCGDHLYTYLDFNFPYSNAASGFVYDYSSGAEFRAGPGGTSNGFDVDTSRFIPDIQSTEWMVERPVLCQHPVSQPYGDLANFHYVNWHGQNGETPEALPNYSGSSWGHIGNFVHYSMSMVNNNGVPLARPSDLDSNGYFTTNFQNVADDWNC